MTKVVILTSGRVRRVKLDFSIQRVAKEILIIRLRNTLCEVIFFFFFSFLLIENFGFPALLNFAETKIRINDNIFQYFNRFGNRFLYLFLRVYMDYRPLTLKQSIDLALI